MKNYVGIDLGTTNSAIASFNGEEVRIWKSREQNDVTPSVIYIDRRGNKYVGRTAYDKAPHDPDSAASLFKRLMGTSTPVHLPAVGLTKTPEECSAEVLKVLFCYLPEEMRDAVDTGTVITVPAAFNQMQKDATKQAAVLADIGKVALMQEPVAAVMSVMRTRKQNGIFVIYDLGGGTLDVAIAEAFEGRVNMLAHGGIAMCGGRDWDRVLLDNVVKPWLFDHFDLPDDLVSNPDYKALMRLSAWSAERAKIELSAQKETVISLSEIEVRAKDLSGTKDIYLDIPLNREMLDGYIADRINETIESVRETLTNKAGLAANDVERLVFVGGPTNYKPLRDKVSFELGIEGSTEVNPMTAVCEGAAFFAESIDWRSQNRKRKSNRGKISSSGTKLNVDINYVARTPDARAKITIQVNGKAQDGAEFQVDSSDTGWTSGKLPLTSGTTVEVNLKSGDNVFKVIAFDSAGVSQTLENDKIVIVRTTASLDAIPASYSIGIEALENLGGQPTLEWLVRAEDPLPKKGKKIFKTIESLKAGSSGAINFKLWEGEIEDPVSDNRFIGMLKVTGADFDDGVIAAGDDLICEYEVLDSGNIVLEVSVPSIGASFPSDCNFYSRMDGQVDFSNATTRVVEDSKITMEKLNEISSVVDNPKIQHIRHKLSKATDLVREDHDAEQAQEAMESVYDAKRLLATVRKEHSQEIRQIDLDREKDIFDSHVREYARPSEEKAFDNLVRTSQREIDRNGTGFDNHLYELQRNISGILFRQDWHVINIFNQMVRSPHHFSDQGKFNELVEEGKQYLVSDQIDELRNIVYKLSSIQIRSVSEAQLLDSANIVRE